MTESQSFVQLGTVARLVPIINDETEDNQWGSTLRHPFLEPGLFSIVWGGSLTNAQPFFVATMWLFLFFLAMLQNSALSFLLLEFLVRDYFTDAEVRSDWGLDCSDGWTDGSIQDISASC
jgi:hypothetical protein